MAFIMMLLALPAAIISERGGGGGRLLVALGLGLGFLLVDGILAAFGTSGRIWRLVWRPRWRRCCSRRWVSGSCAAANGIDPGGDYKSFTCTVSGSHYDARNHEGVVEVGMISICIRKGTCLE